MDKNNQKIQVLFHAYIDGRIDKSVRAKFERYLQKNPVLSEELAKYQVIDKHIKDTFEGVAHKPIPNKFTDLINNYGNVKQSRSGFIHGWWNKLKQLAPPQISALHYVFTVCVLLAGFIAGQLVPLGDSRKSPTDIPAKIEQLALDAHLIYSAEKRHAVEVNAKEKAHLMKWLSARLETKVGPAQLAQHKYQLMGGRLLPSLGNHAAFYMYKDNNDKRLTLYIRKIEQMQPNSDIHCKPDVLDTFICSWTGDKLAYFLIGQTSVDDMNEIARSVHGQLQE